MSAVRSAARVIPTQFAPADGRRLDRRGAGAPRRVRRATVSPRALQRAAGDDFELLRELGTVSYSVEQQAGEATLKWRGGDDGTVPDSFSVVGASPLAGGVAEMKLYAGKVVGWEGPDGGERGSRVPDVLMKEYCNEIAASMADAEVEAYTKLYSNPNDSTIEQTWDGQAVGTPFDPASLPVVPLVAYFKSDAVAGIGESLWTVQAWGPGGLSRLAEYPGKTQEVKKPSFWPPIQRVRDNGLGPRHRFVRNAMVGVLAAVDAIHRRGVAHNAIDASSFQMSTLTDQKADELEVRLMNLGFAGDLTEDRRREDLRCAAVVCAELVFSALSTYGSDNGRTSASAIQRLFESVFALDMAQAREYCVEEPEWAAVVEFWDYRDRQGDGWGLLRDVWRGELSAEELLARAEAIETPYD